MTRLHRASLASERGAALIVALIVLTVVSALASVVMMSAIATDDVTMRDTNYKNALEASEAGLQVGLYRLNMVYPDANHCVGDGAQTPGSTGLCASSSYTLGNGSTYQYWSSLPLSSSQTCAGEPLNGIDVSQRCITALGVSNGVSARSQIRVASFTAAPLFPVAGLIGLKNVTLNGNAAVTGSSASNVSVSAVGNATSQGIVLGPGGTYSHSGNANGGTVATLSAPLVLSPVSPGNSATVNSDARIVNGINNAGTSGTPVTPYDQASATGVSFDPTTRTLTLSGNGSLQLGGGVYNFCELDTTGKASLSIAPGVQAEIFIDSPDDPGSGCPSGTGDLNLAGNGAVNPSGNPLALQLYVYGLNNGSGTVSVTGNGVFYGVVYAPLSQVTLSGNGVIDGAVAGRTSTVSGNGFNFDTRTSTLQASTNGLSYRTAWAQCSPTYSPSSPGTC